MEIREARAEECAEASRVTQDPWREFERPGDPVWSRYFEILGDVAGRASRALVLVAVESGRVVGTATVELSETIEDGQLAPDQANFRMLAVDPGWRGRGVGRRLVEACIEGARIAGKRIATLHTGEEMVAAAALYRSFGFERDPAADFDVADDVTLLAYRLSL